MAGARPSTLLSALLCLLPLPLSSLANESKLKAQTPWTSQARWALIIPDPDVEAAHAPVVPSILKAQGAQRSVHADATAQAVAAAGGQRSDSRIEFGGQESGRRDRHRDVSVPIPSLLLLSD
jgi:hypothetical protein